MACRWEDGTGEGITLSTSGTGTEGRRLEQDMTWYPGDTAE